LCRRLRQSNNIRRSAPPQPFLLYFLPTILHPSP